MCADVPLQAYEFSSRLVTSICWWCVGGMSSLALPGWWGPVFQCYCQGCATARRKVFKTWYVYSHKGVQCYQTTRLGFVCSTSSS